VKSYVDRASGQRVQIRRQGHLRPLWEAWALAGEDVAAARERLALADANRRLGAAAAAQPGHIDDVIRPGEQRGRLALALAMTGSERGARGRARNISL
jgi:hypothetical protein